MATLATGGGPQQASDELTGFRDLWAAISGDAALHASIVAAMKAKGVATPGNPPAPPPPAEPPADADGSDGAVDGPLGTVPPTADHK